MAKVFDIPEWRTNLAKEIMAGYDDHDDQSRRGVEDEIRRISNPLRLGDSGDESSHYEAEDDMFDTTVREAKMICINGIMSKMFPYTDKWFDHRYKPDPKIAGKDPDEDKKRRALKKITNLQFAQLSEDNFYAAMTEALHDYLDFGNTNIRMTKGKRRFVNFRAIEKGRYMFQLDDEGFEEIVWMKDRLTVTEIAGMFGDKALPEKINEAREQKKWNQKFDIYHRVSRRGMFKEGPQANPENREWESVWVSAADKDLIGNSSIPRRKVVYKDGLYEMPYTIGRLMTRAGQNQGEGLTTMILPMIRTANQKAINVEKAENFAVDPAWYQDDNNPLDDILPGSKVSVSPYDQFRPEPIQMQMQGIDYEKSGLEAIREKIRDIFFNNLFKLFTNMDVATNRKTAYETRIMRSEQLSLLTTLLFNLTEEIVKPILEKHLQMMISEKKIPVELVKDMPDEFEIQLTTQLAKSIETTRVEDFMSFIELGAMVDQTIPGATNATIDAAKSLRNIGLTMEIPVDELYTEDEAKQRLEEAQERQRQIEQAAIMNQAAGAASQIQQ